MRIAMFDGQAAGWPPTRDPPMSLSVSSVAVGVVAGSGAGTRSESQVKREGIDQDIKLCGFEIIIATGPI